MKPHEFKAALVRLNLTTQEIARWLGVDDRSVRRYIAGTRPVPQPLALLLVCLLVQPPLLGIVRGKVALDEAQRMPEDDLPPGDRRSHECKRETWASREVVG